MSETIIETLQRLEYQDIKIYNRTRERAERFSNSHGKIPFYTADQFVEALHQADLVFVATSSLMPIVTKEEMQGRSSSSACYLFDMAVPRNVAEEVSSLEGVELYTIDDLRNTSDGTFLEDPDFEAINKCITDMVEQFLQWMDASAVREVIQVIQRASDRLLEKELSKLPSQLSDAERTLVTQFDHQLREAFSKAVVVATRKVTDDGKKLKYSEAIGILFNEILDQVQ